LLRPEDAPEGCWEKDTLKAMKAVTPGCVILVTKVHSLASSGDENGDGEDAKKSKRAKRTRRMPDARRRTAGAGRAWPARRISRWRAGTVTGIRGRA
jgi:hypothetical protein